MRNQTFDNLKKNPITTVLLCKNCTVLADITYYIYISRERERESERERERGGGHKSDISNC